jgi:hypothetical protein
LEVVRASKRKKSATTTGGLAQMKHLMNWWLICGWVALTPTVFAGSQMDSITIGYSSFSGAYGPLWIAIEDQKRKNRKRKGEIARATMKLKKLNLATLLIGKKVWS